MFRPFVLAATIAVGACPATSAPSEKASDLISYLMNELGDIRETIEDREAATTEVGGWFSAGAADYEADLNEALDRALEIATPSTHSSWSEKVARIENSVAEAEALRAELIVKRAAADTSKGVGLVDRLMGREHARGSLEEIESRIAEVDAATAQLKSDREVAVVGFKEEMSEQHDISLSVDQARSLLFPVNGSLMVEAAVVIKTLSEVEKQLSAINNEELGARASRPYLGVASLTRLIYARMLAQHLAAYDGDWLPALHRMRAETQNLLAQTRAEAASATQPATRRTYAVNMEIQERILQVSARYEEMLLSRREETETLLKGAEEVAMAAVNTLLTLETASAVSGLMTDSYSAFQTVDKVYVPEFQNLKQEDFEQLLAISELLSS